ncbi:MAG TPA: LysR substrate-binding domain-containing protein, partial [Burkholderiaceae bacterium]|nr:LysR substrate-binding domain-containing protein [Burkholderiaceae bacterium]
AQAPRLSMRVIPSSVPTVEGLRDHHCQLVISPRPPESTDIVQKRLFEDRYCVFFDARERAAPAGVADYESAEHVTVLYEPRRTLEIDRVLAERGVRRRFVAWVPGFSGIPPFLRGTRSLATLPSLLRADLLRDFATASVPVDTPPMPMYMLWHVRHQHDPVHCWVREELTALVAPALAQVATACPN